MKCPAAVNTRTGWKWYSRKPWNGLIAFAAGFTTTIAAVHAVVGLVVR